MRKNQLIAQKLYELAILFGGIAEISMNSENKNTEVPFQVLPLKKEKKLTKKEIASIRKTISTKRLNQIQN